jgi:NADPH-ferrihemoprotein reductase
VRSSGFALPKDPAAPVIMIGPGTGVAPFRAFLQQMAADRARAAPGGEHTPGGAPPAAARSGATWLYFGCRREEEDYLYREELEAHLAEGTLTRLRLAFSRAQAAKVYVQHLLREDGAELWALLQRGGHVYICGGTLMGRDVVETLSAAVARHGALGAEGAAKYLKEMEAAGRLVKELWS